jgi:hypothetical protein
MNKALIQKTHTDLYDNINYGAFKLYGIIKNHQPLLTADSKVSLLLNELQSWLDNAASGEKPSLSILMNKGPEVLETVLILLRESAMNDNYVNGNYIKERSVSRRGVGYSQLWRDLLDFENKYLQKIIAVCA